MKVTASERKKILFLYQQQTSEKISSSDEKIIIVTAARKINILSVIFISFRVLFTIFRFDTTFSTAWRFQCFHRNNPNSHFNSTTSDNYSRYRYRYRFHFDSETEQRNKFYRQITPPLALCCSPASSIFQRDSIAQKPFKIKWKAFLHFYSPSSSSFFFIYSRGFIERDKSRVAGLFTLLLSDKIRANLLRLWLKRLAVKRTLIPAIRNLIVSEDWCRSWDDHLFA